MSAAGPHGMSPSEYLAWERTQACKHEYHRGEVFAMAGASPRHNLLATAVAAELRAATRGLGCRALNSDQRIVADDGQRYVYADAVVVCGEMSTQPGAADVLANPRIVVEVVSRSTEAYDRGEKWEAYQRLASVTDYLLVSQAAVRVEHYARDSERGWHYQVLGAGDTIRLSNGASVAVDAIYEGAFDVAGDGS